MAEVNWREVFAVSSFVLALMLIGGSIYLHVQHKHHFGRMHHESSASVSSGVDAAVVMASQPLPPATPILPAATHSDHDDIDATTRGTPRRVYSEEDSASGSGDSDSDESSDESYEDYEEIVKYKQHLEERVNAIISSLADKSTSESMSVESLSESAADSLSMSSSSGASRATASSWRHITEACLQCVWETVAQCRPASCNSNVPGRISQPYWLDAGKPKLEGDHSKTGEMDEGYAHCVNNAYCAGRAVSAFVNKYARDCNQDGVIDCRDHIALHILGPSGCLTSELLPVFESRMENCLENFEGQGRGEE